MLASASTLVRLSLHVLATTVWVGGQLTLGGLVPTLRRVSPESTQAVARAFARLAWPAYGALVLTGFWNLAAVDLSKQTAAWRGVLVAKIIVVAASGLSAFLHQRAKTTAGLAGWGAAASVTTVAALVLGVSLGG
ncbi:MAG TPA: hypothetical protein VNF50_13590 [Acidimicrobiales bacterium]|nr:hypothetical protein [Acidimicrobiales bacterium]